jgi:hypothetical protein
MSHAFTSQQGVENDMRLFLTKAGLLTGLICALVFGYGTIASANTITPTYVLGSFIPGTSIGYQAIVTTAELHSGDGFTILDLGGYSGTIVAPTDWTYSVQLLGSPWGTPGAESGSPQDGTNINFTYTGPDIQIDSFFIYTGFVVGTTSLNTSNTGQWISRDHALGPTPAIDGGFNPTHSDVIVTPAAVPDGGWTVAMLGSALFAIGLLRRRFGVR